MTVQLQGDTAEVVAYFLLLGIAESEGKGVQQGSIISADKDWLLMTYQDCLRAVRLEWPRAIREIPTEELQALIRRFETFGM
jgi:hypothetical protein